LTSLLAQWVVMTSVLWFRRDLRLRDHPALAAAAASGPVLPLFVLDPVLTRSAGANRLYVRRWQDDPAKPVVDHADERREALARLERMTG